MSEVSPPELALFVNLSSHVCLFSVKDNIIPSDTRFRLPTQVDGVAIEAYRCSSFCQELVHKNILDPSISDELQWNSGKKYPSEAFICVTFCLQ